jgi:hypothetical protein
MRGMSTLAALSLLVLAVAGAPPPALQVSVEEMPQFDAMFRRTTGWTGADVAATVPLAPGLTLWLFGDTWVGEIVGGKHARATMINNSLAIQQGNRPPDARVEFFATRPGTAKPTAILVPTDGGFFWPQSGVRTSKGLFLFALHVEKHGDPNDAMGFRLTGVDLLRVDGPPDRPDRWQVHQQRLPWCHPDAQQSGIYLGAALMKHAGWVYVYGCEEARTARSHVKHAVVARVREEQIDDLPAWRFYRHGQWAAGGEKPDRLFAPTANEYSVSYQPGLRQFIAVYTPGGLSRKIEIRLAPAPEGPWGDPIEVYACPEMLRDKKIFCYAAKGHAELSGDDELIVTYATNSFDFWYTASHAEYYWPRFICLKFNKAPNHGSTRQ